MDKKLPIGIVVIGRNERERLHRCLISCIGQTEGIVYVDSGSTDDSVSYANKLGIDVVQLDSSIPFTAARARNEGAKRIVALYPLIQYIQFVDGDCEVVPGWFSKAFHVLNSHPDVAIVCGRLRERYPEASVYNRICDMEWNEPTGEVNGCGGIFMIRANFFNEIGGFNSKIIAGEEPELCLRILRCNKKILRIEDEMAIHDANMKSFLQWWVREVRTGHSFAEGMAMYINDNEKFRLRECVRIWFWAVVLPIFVIMLVMQFSKIYLSILLIYPIKVWHISVSLENRIKRSGDGLLYALSCILSCWPMVIGQIKFCINRFIGKRTKIIEYK